MGQSGSLLLLERRCRWFKSSYPDYILLQVVQWAAFYCWRDSMEAKYKEIAIETKYGKDRMTYTIEYSDKEWGSIASQLSNGMSWIGAGEYLFKADDIVLIKKRR